MGSFAPGVKLWRSPTGCRTSCKKDGRLDVSAFCGIHKAVHPASLGEFFLLCNYSGLVLDLIG